MGGRSAHGRFQDQVTMARTTYGALKLIRNYRLPWSALGRRWAGTVRRSMRDRGTKPLHLIGLIAAGDLMSRLLLTDEPPTPYGPHCGQPMKLVRIIRLLGRS